MQDCAPNILTLPDIRRRWNLIATAIGLSVNMSNDQRRQIVAKDYKNLLVFLKCVTDICVRVCFCLRTDFPVKQIHKSKYQVGSGNETIEFRSFLPSACRRRRAQHSTHWSAHAHHRHAENRRSEALPPSPVVFVLVWRWVVINKRLTCLPVPRIYSLLSKRQTAHI